MRIQKFDTVVSVLCCALLGFFAWHATKGPRGFAYTEKLASETEQLQSQLDSVQAQRTKLNLRVAALRPESIDPDLLDEEARQVLFLAKANEIVVLRQR